MKLEVLYTSTIIVSESSQHSTVTVIMNEYNVNFEF